MEILIRTHLPSVDVWSSQRYVTVQLSASGQPLPLHNDSVFVEGW